MQKGGIANYETQIEKKKQELGERNKHPIASSSQFDNHTLKLLSWGGGEQYLDLSWTAIQVMKFETLSSCEWE